MFDFANPLWLLLILVVPLLVWRWLRRPRGTIRFPAADLLAAMPRGRSRLARWAGANGRGATLLLVIIGLAGLRWPDQRTRIPTEGVAIQMLVDVSGSMAEHDFDWNGRPISRLDAVKRVFHLLIVGGEAPDGLAFEGRPNDLVGFVTFATWPESPCPLTLSHSVLLQMLDAEKPRTLPTESRTNIGDAIAWGLHRLAAAPSPRKVLILLSDGEHNVPPPALTPRQAAQLAASLRVPVYAIDAGPDLPPASPEGLELDSEAATAAKLRAAGVQTLQAIAQTTNGRYFRAPDTQSLLAVCRTIDVLERSEIRSFLYRRYYQGYHWAGLAALVLWVGLYLAERTIWRRLP
jgi:Ca-activated chloride channel family protein